MRSTVDIVTTITHIEQLQLLQSQSHSVNLVEIRADLIPELNLTKRISTISTVYILRSKKSGGNYTGSLTARHQLLKQALQHFDFIEMEIEYDLHEDLLKAIPKERRRVVHYANGNKNEEFSFLLKKLVEVPAHRYKIILENTNNEELCSLLCLLNDQQKKIPVVVYGTGMGAEWSQVLSPFLGSREVPSSISKKELTSPHFTPKQLQEDYGLPYVYDLEQLFGIVGNPVLGSISPKLHNEAYRNLELPYLYLPFQVEDFFSFKERLMDSTSVLPISLNGLTVVAPFKEAGYSTSKYKEIAPNSYARACNGMVRSGSDWRGFSTDAHGAIEALQETLENWIDKQIAIVGCGGAGRSIAAALKRKNKNITMVNRTKKTGATIADSLALPFVPLERFDPSTFDIIIHATPLGKNVGETPFKINQLSGQNLIIDHVYATHGNTPLVQYCHLRNIKVVDGKEIARLQIAQQFKYMTELEMPHAENIKQNLKIN